jgi:hypothetical protein
LTRTAIYRTTRSSSFPSASAQSSAITHAPSLSSTDIRTTRSYPAHSPSALFFSVLDSASDSLRLASFAHGKCIHIGHCASLITDYKRILSGVAPRPPTLVVFPLQSILFLPLPLPQKQHSTLFSTPHPTLDQITPVGFGLTHPSTHTNKQNIESLDKETNRHDETHDPTAHSHAHHTLQ